MTTWFPDRLRIMAGGGIQPVSRLRVIRLVPSQGVFCESPMRLLCVALGAALEAPLHARLAALEATEASQRPRVNKIPFRRIRR